MTEDSAFQWDFDTEFRLSGNVHIRVLQRTVHDPSVLNVDLRPFEEMPAFWAIEGERTHSGEATLLSYRNEGSDDYYSVSFRGSDKVDAVVRFVKNRQITVWRWANELDMVQLRVCWGETHFVYAQVGGTRTVPALAMSQRSEMHDPVAVRARKLYRTGELIDESSY